MLTFPDAPRTFPDSNLETSMLPDTPRKHSQTPYGNLGSGNVVPNARFSSTFPERSQTDDQSRQAPTAGPGLSGKDRLSAAVLGA
jgi:hypothetical protein